jgi:hypothetical protein
MGSTGKFVLRNGFYSSLEVTRLIWTAKSPSVAPLGAWLLMGSYHANHPKYGIPHGARRMMGAKPKDIKTLIEFGFLLEGDREWTLGYQGHLWEISYGRDGSRAPIPAEVRTVVMDRDGKTCVLCSTTDDLTLDHIVPWSHGGPDTVGNLRVLCRSCNSRRGNRAES